MTLNVPRVRDYLQNFEMPKLFVEELGWNRHNSTVPVTVDGQSFTLRAFAEKRGVQIFECHGGPDGHIPAYDVRRKIEKEITKSAFEHLIIFVDGSKTTQVWQWVARGPGQPAAYREHTYHPKSQSGDALIQKLAAITIPLSDEEGIDLTGTVQRLRDAFDRDRVTKRFYDLFKREHGAFLEFIAGIKDQADKEWYASLMLNRLMFVYFIQKKGFLDGNLDYLRDRLEQVQSRKGKGKFQTFYRFFLLCLFHEGFSKQPAARKLAGDLTELLGQVPYLNGGLFDVHEIERRNDKIEIPDEAFENLFSFFDQYEWHLDTRPLSNDREINPDVLGYIFEKYINQKQMGAYYTKEDITDYISKNTIIPWLFDTAQKKCAVAFQPGSALWRLLKDNPDCYLYSAVRHGVIDEQGKVIPLPKDIQRGVKDVSQRDGWNRGAEATFALPTETWREHVARRERCLELRDKLVAGEVHAVNDLISHNLDIRQFAADCIAGCEGPELLRAIYQSISSVTVLDPTCGSGAFLFAALNILEPLYEACLDRMQAFVEDIDREGETASKKTFEDFRKILTDVARHPNRTYFILKSIIVHNLYGVDIMEEAVEICKLRLFLKLVSQVERVKDLEPLPDIDFNIRPGNTLVGYASLDAVRRSLKGTLGFAKEDVDQIVEEAEIVDSAFRKFHEMQTNFGMDGASFASAKQDLRERLDRLADNLDRYLAGEFGVDPNKPKKYAEWQKNHLPFHWFAEFYGIIQSGGFNVIVGNPPYVEYAKVRGAYSVRGFQTMSCGNLFALVMERSGSLLDKCGRLGLIVPLSLVCTDRMSDARTLLKRGTVWMPCFDIRPSSLFEGIAQRLTIILQDATPTPKPIMFSGGYRRWSSPERAHLLPVTKFTRIHATKVEAPLAKISHSDEVTILGKIAGPLLSTLVSESGDAIFVHRICRYFIKALDFVPYFRDAEGIKGKSEDYKPFIFNESCRDSILCFVNSSLFYWFWRAHGDGFHCGYGDVYLAPWCTSLSRSESAKFSSLASELMTSLKDNSVRKTIRTKKGDIAYQEFSAKPTKPILDEIDALLGSAIGLSLEQTDFIVNYDIKYRMGQEDAEDDE